MMFSAQVHAAGVLVRGHSEKCGGQLPGVANHLRCRSSGKSPSSLAHFLYIPLSPPRSQMKNNGGSGVVVRDGADVLLDGNDIQDNADYGVRSPISEKKSAALQSLWNRPRSPHLPGLIGLCPTLLAFRSPRFFPRCTSADLRQVGVA